jgi:hypothetical protein
MDDRDGALEQRSRALLIDSAENLSGSVRSRLTQARHAALAARHARLRYRLQRWVPAGAVAAAALALLVVFVPHGQHQSISAANPLFNNPGGAEDIELLSSGVPLNTDQEVDDDFYEWAVGTAGASPAGSAHAVATGTNGT